MRKSPAGPKGGTADRLSFIDFQLPSLSDAQQQVTPAIGRLLMGLLTRYAKLAGEAVDLALDYVLETANIPRGFTARL